MQERPGNVSHHLSVLVANLAALLQLKKRFPRLRTTLSVGGGDVAMPFKTAAATNASRATFAQSCAALAARYSFDGLDGIAPITRACASLNLTGGGASGLGGARPIGRDDVPAADGRPARRPPSRVVTDHGQQHPERATIPDGGRHRPRCRLDQHHVGRSHAHPCIRLRLTR